MRIATATFALVMLTTPAFAGGWTLDGDASSLSFGSIKNDSVGESHMFQTLSGGVDGEGAVSLTIDLASVETNIDIRNERMLEHVFAGVATADLAASIDMAAMEALGVGEHMTTEVDFDLSVLGQEVAWYAPMFVMRVAEDRVLATTDGMVFLTTEEAGVDGGVDVLQELASLDSITRVFPVSARFVFDAE